MSLRRLCTVCNLPCTYTLFRLISVAKYVLSSVSIGSRANKVWNIPLTYCTLYHDAAPGCLITSFCKNRKWTTSSTDLLQAYRRVVYKAPTRRPDRLALRILHFRALRLILLADFFRPRQRATINLWLLSLRPCISGTSERQYLSKALPGDRSYPFRFSSTFQ